MRGAHHLPYSEGGLLQAAKYPYSIFHVWVSVIREQLGDPTVVENCQSEGICCECLEYKGFALSNVPRRSRKHNNKSVWNVRL